MQRRLLLFLTMQLTLFGGQAGVAHGQSRYNEPFPEAPSKKGLQVELVDDAIALGVKHATVNVDLCRLIDPAAKGKGPTWNVDGVTYSFRNDFLQSLDRQIKPLSDRGVLIYVILLAYRSGNSDVDEILIHPDCVVNPPNRLGAFNNRTEIGRRWLVATMQFLAERWSRPDRTHGRVVGWIVGNEVNSHWWWSNRGRIGMQEFAVDYEQVVRLVHSAVRSQSASDRVYVSLEHHWNIRYAAGDAFQSFPSRGFLIHFNELVRQQGDFDWHLAFHPYPENLFEPRFWLDRTATERPDTPRITFRNLPMLTAFMQLAQMRYGGRPRRVILSEQGFHSADDAQSERLQAAAYCYAYRIADELPAINAFILHRHIDHPAEVGLNLGLRRRGAGGMHPAKPIYDCFRLADTPQWQSAFQFALPMIGLKEWPARPPVETVVSTYAT